MSMIKYDGVDSVIKSALNPDEKPKGKIFNEAETRRRLLAFAKARGCDIEVTRVFNRYDRLLRNCQDVTERKHIAVLAMAELNKVMGFTGGFTVGNLEVAGTDEKPESD